MHSVHETWTSEMAEAHVPAQVYSLSRSIPCLAFTGCKGYWVATVVYTGFVSLWGPLPYIFFFDEEVLYHMI